ncbi:Protein IQ-DOMAIN 32 [Rhynchospora pubera]|uniref:Protein IQ-DOMAIN 32 n=1 Tax=Rhynchospora pubera TaxID=906938 RepID=A0AAV8E589_9POAL|nr:Protein IQ-DOMAIN 32 [Rhynchospora pubera]
MGRSKNACFNILTCAGAGGGGGDVAADPANSATATNEYHSEESKVLSDKSRWSFRRRSTRHRVLRNNESTEVETVMQNKENPNADLINDSSFNGSYSPKYSTEKTVEQEKPKENNIVVREIEDKLTENDIVIKESVKETHDELKDNLVVEEREEKLEEDVAVKDVEMDLEQENIPASEDASKISEQNENLEPAALVIQSGFRGYMTRKESVKLRNVVKIQAAARGFLVRSQAAGTLRCLLAIIKMQAVVRSRQTPKKADLADITQGSGGSFSQGNKACSSSDNLLLNGFACKIMDTMPKTKAIHIKCDPYKPDCTWQWLERWTYTITPSSGLQLPDQKEIIESETVITESNAVDSHADCSLPSDAPNSNSYFNSNDQIEAPEDDLSAAVMPKEELEMKLVENGVHACDLEEENSDLSPKFDVKPDINLSCENPELDGLAEAKLEDSEVQKAGSKKAINPNFVAAQMKFQELSSNSNLSAARSLSSNKSFTFPSQADDVSSKDLNNNIANHETNNITAGGALIKAVSECGTEISISSTLDSPDRSEAEGGEIVLEIGALENKNYQIHADSEVTETKVESETKNPELEFQPEPTKEPKETINDSINTPTESVEIERILRSPEGTPISHTTTTVTDMHGTPSSQSSVNTKTSKRERKKKPSSISTKRSLNSPINGSSNNNNGVIKRNGSIGHSGDSEPRISNSSLPSYMQATESARAKLHPSLSPKMSPDISETNGSGKKRHSLPIGGPGGAGGKDSSPRMQRSQSHQAQVNAKGSGTQSHGSSERRWQR